MQSYTEEEKQRNLVLACCNGHPAAEKEVAKALKRCGFKDTVQLTLIPSEEDVIARKMYSYKALAQGQPPSKKFRIGALDELSFDRLSLSFVEAASYEAVPKRWTPGQ
jgi:hypothetical protein